MDHTLPADRQDDETRQGARFRAPTALHRTDLPLTRVLIIGSCLASRWLDFIRQDGLQLDYILTNNFSPLPENPPAPLEDYDFQVIQIPLRSVLHENTYSHLPYNDPAAHENLFRNAQQWIVRYLDILLHWNRTSGLLSFVTNFLVPQQNPLGRLLPRHDLRNLVYFIEQLNIFIGREAARRANVYLLDIDQIAATIGRQHVQDDIINTISHGGLLNDNSHRLDRNRIQPPLRVSDYYPTITQGERTFHAMAWAELTSMHRTIHQIDTVKLVIVDLDDTIWRGVVAENGQIDADTIEGWPIGVMEALCFLKKRGILLAIASKNDEARILALWNKIVGGRLKLESFAVRKINWLDKSENIHQILREVNLTPRNAIFIDDNPVERAAVQAAFPDMRVLSADPYHLRRILLWSPELQVPTITDESNRRTEMVQSQIEREAIRETMSREAFLQSLELKMRIMEITSTDHAKFPRAMELINKSNQFNTTGQRWSAEELHAFLAAGGALHAFELQDKFSHYGLVGVALFVRSHIEQFVMSCRVVGLDAEIALIAHLGRQSAEAGLPVITAVTIETDLNALSRDLYRKTGFGSIGALWQAAPTALPSFPPCIELESAG